MKFLIFFWELRFRLSTDGGLDLVQLEGVILNLLPNRPTGPTVVCTKSVMCVIWKTLLNTMLQLLVFERP